jgi:hypothetical protein
MPREARRPLLPLALLPQVLGAVEVRSRLADFMLLRPHVFYIISGDGDAVVIHRQPAQHDHSLLYLPT